MIVEAVRLGAIEDAPAGDVEVVAVDLDPRPESAQAVGGALDPVRFLVTELAGAVDDRRPRCR